MPLPNTSFSLSNLFSLSLNTKDSKKTQRPQWISDRDTIFFVILPTQPEHSEGGERSDGPERPERERYRSL